MEAVTPGWRYMTSTTLSFSVNFPFLFHFLFLFIILKFSFPFLSFLFTFLSLLPPFLPVWPSLAFLPPETLTNAKPSITSFNSSHRKILLFPLFSGIASWILLGCLGLPSWLEPMPPPSCLATSHTVDQ